MILHLGPDEKFFNAVAIQISENENVELKVNKESVSALNNNLAAINKQLNNLVDALSNGGHGDSIAPITDRIKSLTNEK